MSNGYLGRKYRGDGENKDKQYIASQKKISSRSNLKSVSYFEGDMYCW